MWRRLAFALIASSLQVLTACGGGSGGGGDNGGTPSPVAPAPAPPAAAGAIAGALLIASTSQSDGDVNDPTAPYRGNDTAQSAQRLPVPVVLGGYVNQPGRGPAGRSSAAGDVEDIFVADLLAGQVIELVVPSADPSLGDAQRDDADLGLYDAAGTLVDESAGLGQFERIVVPAAGAFYVRVTAYSGAPLYRLSIGQSVPGGSTSAELRLSDEFVPGELIVTLAGTAADASMKATSTDVEARLASTHGLQRKAGAPGRELLYEMAAGPAGAMKASGTATVSEPSSATGLSVPARLADKRATLFEAKRLQTDPALRAVGLNRIVRTRAVPNDPGYNLERWHYEMIHLPAAWDVTRGRPDVVVAVVDTGVVRAHPDLANKLVDGFDFIRDPGNEDGDGLDGDPDDPGCVLGGGSVFHGTHVAGTIAAATNNGQGVAGVAWDARVMPLRVLDGCVGSGSTYDIAQAVRYAAGLSNDSGRLPSRRADVINLSLGAQAACDTATAELYATVRAEGVIVVASAGNDATSTESTPAACANVIAVAAVDSRRERAAYSNFGSWVDIAAPGGDMRFDHNGDGQLDGVYSTHATGGGGERQASYRLLQGTSMAAPHFSGVVALMKSVNPALSPANLDTLISQGRITVDIGTAGPDELGAGLVDALLAVRAATINPDPLPPGLTVTPSSLNLGDLATRADVIVSNSGSGSLTVTEIRTSASWLRVIAASADGAGLGRYTVVAERAGLAPGTYEGWVEFVSSAGTRRVSIVMQVVAADLAPDAGQQYVLLVDPDTRAPRGPEVTVRVRGTSTPYRVNGIAPGRYIVFAGTDMDNDGVICEDGEACGAYPVEPEPTVVEVTTGTVSGLDFTTAYRTNIEAGG